MAKKVTGFIKLQIEAGKANPSPPIGPALGQKGVILWSFVRHLMQKLKKMQVQFCLTIITVYTDRSFSFVTKTPPASYLLKTSLLKKGTKTRSRGRGVCSSKSCGRDCRSKEA